MSLLIIYLVIALSVSFLCSLLEAVLLTSTPAYIQVNVRNGKKSAIFLKGLKENIDRPIAAILTLNTIAHTMGAALIGAQVQTLWGDKYLTAASVVLTLLILVFSEIVPKIIGATQWKTLAPFSAFIIRYLVLILWPFVMFSNWLSQLLHGGKDEGLTREEVIETAELGAVEGSLKKKESLIIKNLLLSKIYVYDIMTPRSVLFALDENMTVAEVMEKHRPLRFSRVPIYRDNLDNIQGMVHRYKVLEASSRDQHDMTMKELMTPVQTVSEDVPISSLLDQFIQRQEHLFVVVDDYGSTMGIVTLEDAIETLLGVEIVDEFDSVADLRQLALEQWKARKKMRSPMEQE
jgi:CBS domain containing-hemolysin-like protein